MDIKKVIAYVMNQYGDPFDEDAVKVIHNRIENEKSAIGKLIRKLLIEAEKGNFK